ncbi:hypothetical protein [Nonomuraea jabiensis]|uniref:hypothetical protein n=1 Tax=Nonomuraea jabiensis TaxID=882448 RepID=UPI0036A2FEFD
MTIEHTARAGRGTLQRVRFVSRLSGNAEDGGVDPIVVERLRLDHPLTRHLGDFLIDLSNAGSSANTVRGHRGDLIPSPPTTTARLAS